MTYQYTNDHRNDVSFCCVDPAYFVRKYHACCRTCHRWSTKVLWSQSSLIQSLSDCITQSSCFLSGRAINGTESWTACHLRMICTCLSFFRKQFPLHWYCPFTSLIQTITTFSYSLKHLLWMLPQFYTADDTVIWLGETTVMTSKWSD